MSIAVLPSPRISTRHTDSPPDPILQVRNVCKGYGSGVTRNEVLTNINLNIREGEFLAVVGFSGSGKTTFTQLLAGLIRPDSGEITMDGEVITGPGPDRGLVFQNYSLLPWLTVRGNIALSVDRVFRDWTKARRKEHVEKFIEMVGLSHAAHRRPHELSGGMRQRVMIAMALACNPDLLIADEPTTALDVTVQAQILELLRELQEETGMAMILISHDLGVIAENSQSVAVMYRGRIVEAAGARDLFLAARHPYTAGLMASIPDAETDVDMLEAIPGRVPTIDEAISGCAFHPRCERASDICGRSLPALDLLERHLVMCHHPRGGAS